MNTHTTHTATVASAPTLSEMRARKYAHTVERNDRARRAHADALAVLAIASFVLAVAVAVTVASYLSGVASFAFGSFGRELVRACAWVLSTGSAVLVGFCIRDTRTASAHYKSARMARAKACAELLGMF